MTDHDLRGFTHAVARIERRRRKRDLSTLDTFFTEQRRRFSAMLCRRVETIRNLRIDGMSKHDMTRDCDVLVRGHRVVGNNGRGQAT
jgi:hypothetical protein